MPGGNFSKRLLPTDRYCWSSENGREEKLKENIKLPSFVWQWEHEWKLETKFEEMDLDDDVRYIITNYNNNYYIHTYNNVLYDCI